jgi:UDP-glucuronate decarboxylase
MSNARYLVTGGAGFLGSRLCETLVNRGDEVVCVDSLVTGTKTNLAAILGNQLFDFRRWDVCDPFSLDVDCIYNLACPASPAQYQLNPIDTTRACVLGPLNLLEMAKQTRARILQASTSEVYGDPAVHPQTEDYFGHVNPVGPRACYDEGKRCAESLFFDYRRQYGLSIKVARIFNTYGPRMRPNDGRVVSNFIVQALLGKDITVYGDGAQTRSFCYVDDLVDGLIALMESPAKLTGPINLGNPEEVSVLDLASAIIELVGARSRVVYRPPAEDDPSRRRPDISKAKSLLNWQPQTPLNQGLIKTIAYFDQVLSKSGIRALSTEPTADAGASSASR